jgi:DNA-binding transcriptional regulator/RsmH inhibitor MraZ
MPPSVGGAATVFLGKHDRQLDDKGRLVLPAEYVRQMGDAEAGPRKVVLAPGRGGCLNLFTHQDFQARALELAAPFETDIPEEFFQHCLERDVDKAGRVLIDGAARELAGLDDPTKDAPVQVVVAGSGRYVQIWRKDRHEAKAKPASHFADSVRP